MGSYTRVGLIRSAAGFKRDLAPSGTVNFCIKRGEAAMKKYLGITPATGSNTDAWVEDAATSFACYYLAQRLASQNAPNVFYQRQAQTSRSSEFFGHALIAESWWNAAVRVCDMHGRDIIIERISPSS